MNSTPGCDQVFLRSPETGHCSCERVESDLSLPMSPLRCHLLIGQPASGKTTLAQALAPLLTSPGEPPAQVLSTDAIRAEVFGDAAVQGPWVDIQ